jgi:hypothetical protein
MQERPYSVYVLSPYRRIVDKIDVSATHGEAARDKVAGKALPRGTVVNVYARLGGAEMRPAGSWRKTSASESRWAWNRGGGTPPEEEHPMQEVYTVTTAFNGDSPDGSAMADVRVFATLEAARAYYEAARHGYAGRDYVGLWSTEEPNGPSPDELPAHGWVLAYAAPGEADKEYGAEDEVGIALRAHPVTDFKGRRMT